MQLECCWRVDVKVKVKKHWLAGFAVALVLATPAMAGWKLVPANVPAAVGTMAVTPQTDWNLASARPGKQAFAWTHDGFALNSLEFFVAVPNGQPLYKERDKKRNPMPKFDANALLPDLADFFERSYRTQFQLSDFTVDEIKPIKVSGHPGIRLGYHYSMPNDELVRRGEARMTVVNGKFYALNFTAPELHYFTAGLPEAIAIMENAKF